MPPRRLLTIGVYGFDEATFYAALTGAGAAELVDIRRRRGVRGPQYAFANAKRLQAGLAEHGIAYRHELGLAAPAELIAAEGEADRRAGHARRERAHLSPEFVAGFAEVLAGAEAQVALAGIAPAERPPALLCVEAVPEACHRSLVAAALARVHPDAVVVHLTP